MPENEGAGCELALSNVYMFFMEICRNDFLRSMRDDDSGAFQKKAIIRYMLIKHIPVFMCYPWCLFACGRPSIVFLLVCKKVDNTGKHLVSTCT